MSVIRVFVNGQIRWTVTFSVDNALRDPTTVVFKAQSPTGIIYTYTYGVDLEVTRLSLGVYKLTVAYAAVGIWHFFAEATGDVQTSLEAWSIVRQRIGDTPATIAYDPIVLPEPGMWADPALVCCDGSFIEGGAGCCPPDADMVAWASDLLMKVYGPRWSFGYHRWVERPGFGCYTGHPSAYGAYVYDGYDQRTIELAEDVWPVVKIEQILANGVAIPSNMWRLTTTNQIERLPDPYDTAFRNAIWPFPTRQDLPTEPAYIPVDTSIGSASTLDVERNTDGTWSVGVPGFVGVIPTSDAVVMRNETTGEEWVVPTAGLSGTAPAWTYTPQSFTPGPRWPHTGKERLGIDQSWTLLRWGGYVGYPSTDPPTDETITLYSRNYITNPMWRGPSLEVQYRSGQLPPSAPMLAALLVCDMKKVLCPADEDAVCGLPQGSRIRSISRQGLDLELDEHEAKEAILGWHPLVDAAIRDRTASVPVGVWAPNQSDHNVRIRRRAY